MPEHNDQYNQRERGDTRYQVQKGRLGALTHTIFYSPITTHSHRWHVCKAEKRYFANSEASCLSAPDRQLFVLPSEPSLKIPFRMLGARRYAGRRVGLNFSLPRKTANLKACGSVARSRVH
jgi:hypothetical protein